MTGLKEVILLGFGNVGKAFVEKFFSHPLLGNIYMKAVFSSKGGVIIKDKYDVEHLLNLVRRGEKLDIHPKFENYSFIDYASENPGGILVSTIPPSYATGEPNLTIYRVALKMGYHVVTADKTGLSYNYSGLMKLAKENGVRIKYTATVAAGTPVLSVARSLRYRDVKSIRAILNATSNYVLSLIEKGKDWNEAIGLAIKEKLAEPDPSIDIDGLDAAAKLVIILNEMGVHLNIKEVKTKSIRIYNEDEIRQGIKEGLRLKQVAGYDAKDKEVFVKPIFVPLISPLAFTEGGYNIVEFNVENESIIIHGPAGPSWRTANVLLSDLLELISEIREEN